MLLVPSIGFYKPPLLLDKISSLGPVYSFRRLLNAYTGSCVRIRRTGDNSEQNFGFVDNVVDAAGIATFAAGGGGGSPRIVTLFDQNNNVVDVTQSTSGNQPLFVASGINSLPTARFSAASGEYLSKASVTYSDLTGAVEFTWLGVQNQTGSAAQNTSFHWNNAGGGQQFEGHLSYSDVLYFDLPDTGAGRVSVSQPSGWDDAAHVSELFRTSAPNSSILVDGTSLVGPTSTSSTTLTGTGTFYFGSHNSGAISFTGDISEQVFIKVDTGSTNRGTVRRDGVGTGAAQKSMGTYYGVTVS